MSLGRVVLPVVWWLELPAEPYSGERTCDLRGCPLRATVQVEHEGVVTCGCVLAHLQFAACRKAFGGSRRGQGDG